MATQHSPRTTTAAVALSAARANLLLGSLPISDLRRLVPHLELVEMIASHELYTPTVDIHHVYFPVSGLCSLVAKSNAGAVDVGPIGFDGMVGLPIYLGAPTGP